jgi:FkbM family methyltransferase
MRLRNTAKSIMRKFGYDIVSYDYRYHPVARRMKLIEDNAIDLTLDVGANIGQYALELRRLGYHQSIISFEPLDSAFQVLHARTSSDKLWQAENIALGDEDCISEIKISENSWSSSFLDVMPKHLESAPTARTASTQKVIVKRLDKYLETRSVKHNNIFLKVDTQGYEKPVLDGAGEMLEMIKGVQIEASLVPLYKGEAVLTEMITYMECKGFTLVSLEPGFSDTSSGQLLQTDCLFFRV